MSRPNTVGMPSSRIEIRWISAMVSAVTCLDWLTPCRTLRNEPTRYFLTIPATFAVSSLPSVSISEILIWTICPILSSSVILPRTLSTLASSSPSLLMTGSTFPEQEEAMAPIIAADAARFEIFMVSVLFCVIFMMFSLGFFSGPCIPGFTNIAESCAPGGKRCGPHSRAQLADFLYHPEIFLPEEDRLSRLLEAEPGIKAVKPGLLLIYNE